MLFHAGATAALILNRIARAKFVRLNARHALRVIALKRIVRAGLIGQRLWNNFARVKARQQINRVGKHAHAYGLLCFFQFNGAVNGLIQVREDLIQVAVKLTLFKPFHADIRKQACALVHGDRQRLRAAHAAATRGDIQRAL